MVDGLIRFITDPVSVSMFGVMASTIVLLWSLCCFQDKRHWIGCMGTLVAACLFCAAGSLAFAVLKPPYCPPGERLHGAAGRILWCAP